jgi:hypothetical protein
MRTFRVEYDSLQRKRVVRARLLSTCGAFGLLPATIALILILVFSGVLPKDSEITTRVIWTAIFGASMGSLIFAWRSGMYRWERETVVLMDEDGITKRREGFPDERINYTEIRSLREGRWWLVIVSTKPYGSVTIPRALKGFETIRAELAKHRPLGDRAEAKTSPPRIALSLAAYGLCWGPFVFFAASKSVVLAGVLLLAMLSTAFLIYKAFR